MLSGAGSWRRVVAGLRCARDEVTLVLRVNPEGLGGGLEELLAELDHSGDLASCDAIALYIARPAPYPQQARELAALAPLLDGTAEAARGSPAARS